LIPTKYPENTDTNARGISDGASILKEDDALSSTRILRAIKPEPKNKTRLASELKTKA
jgi:hypothetical protein